MSEEIKTETMCVDMDSIMSRIKKEQEEAQSRSALLKKRVIKELKKIGAATATIQYDGGGDSGFIDGVYVKDKADNDVDLPEGKTVPITFTSSKFVDGKWVNTSKEKLVSLGEALEDLAYDALAGYHPGWEINEGAYGELIIDVKKETATLEHNTRIQDVEYSEHEL